MSNDYSLLTIFVLKESIPAKVESLSDIAYLCTNDNSAIGFVRNRNWLSSLFGKLSTTFSLTSISYLTADASVLGPKQIEGAIDSLNGFFEQVAKDPAPLLKLTRQDSYVSTAELIDALNLPPDLPMPKSCDNDFGQEDAVYMLAFLKAHLAILNCAHGTNAYVLHAQLQ